MATTLEANAANASATAVVALCDGGTIQLQTSGDVEVATLTFSNPAITGTASAGVATFGAITSDSSATGGTVTKAKFYTSGAALILTCAVSTSGSDINMDSVVISAAVSVAITSLTYTQPLS